MAAKILVDNIASFGFGFDSVYVVHRRWINRPRLVWTLQTTVQCAVHIHTGVTGVRTIRTYIVERTQLASVSDWNYAKRYKVSVRSFARHNDRYPRSAAFGLWRNPTRADARCRWRHHHHHTSKLLDAVETTPDAAGWTVADRDPCRHDTMPRPPFRSDCCCCCWTR